MVPVPVPVFVPVPLHLFTQYTPVPLGMPIPVSDVFGTLLTESGVSQEVGEHCLLNGLTTAFRWWAKTSSDSTEKSKAS